MRAFEVARLNRLETGDVEIAERACFADIEQRRTQPHPASSQPAATDAKPLVPEPAAVVDDRTAAPADTAATITPKLKPAMVVKVRTAVTGGQVAAPGPSIVFTTSGDTVERAQSAVSDSGILGKDSPLWVIFLPSPCTDIGPPGYDVTDLAYDVYVDNFVAKLEKTAMVFYGNIAAQAGATVGEVVLGLTVRPFDLVSAKPVLGKLSTTTLWQEVQGAINPIYKSLWIHESHGGTHGDTHGGGH